MANIPEGSKKVVLRKIPLFDLLKLIEHLYSTGADYIDIVGMSFGEGIQDEIMIAVKDEYMSKKENIDDDDDDEEDEDEEEEEIEMEGTAHIISDVEDDEEGPGKNIQARITEQDINDLLDI